MRNNNIKLLDCTLREAPIDGLMWGDMSIRRIINGLEMANVDVIEVGFLKDDPYKLGSTSFHRVEDIEPYLAKKQTHTLYVSLVDFGRYNLANLSQYDGKSIDAIRVCFKHHEIDLVLDYAQKIRDKGYQVAIQHVDTLDYTEDEMINFIGKVNKFKPYAYSVVDTFGAMYEDDMLELTRLADKYLDKDIRLGFHGHNNLMLADANAQRFVQEIGSHRNIIVDASLYGCGRGAGNVHTELISQYLARKHDANYDINEILDLIDTVIVAAQKKTTWGYSIPYFIAGMHNAHTFNVNQLLKRHNLKSRDLRGIIGLLDDKQKKAYDYALLEKLYVDYFNRSVDDSEAIELLRNSWSERKILLLAPGKSVQELKPSIDSFISDNNPIVIAVNNLIDGYVLDYIFYSGAIRYYNLQYQDLKNAGSPTIILSSNIKTQNHENEIIVDYQSIIKFGWVNFDSSAILLLRLLQRCGVDEIYVAGMDGYKKFGESFYSNKLDTAMDENVKIAHTQENISMIKDMKQSNPTLKIRFITPSMYEEEI